jgi:hypothetical protein
LTLNTQNLFFPAIAISLVKRVSAMPENKSLNSSAETKWTSADDIIAYIKRAVPWLSEYIEKALDRPLNSQQATRVGEAFHEIAEGLKDFSSELSKLYIQTQDFTRLLHQIVISVADERKDEKRDLYRTILFEAITSPCEPFERQLQLLGAVEELRMDQMRLLRALAVPVDTSISSALSPLQTLQKRLPDILPDRIRGLLEQMNELGMIELNTLETGHPVHLANSLTSLGHRLLHFMGKKS